MTMGSRASKATTSSLVGKYGRMCWVRLPLPRRSADRRGVVALLAEEPQGVLLDRCPSPGLLAFAQAGSADRQRFAHGAIVAPPVAAAPAAVSVNSVLLSAGGRYTPGRARSSRNSWSAPARRSSSGPSSPARCSHSQARVRASHSARVAAPASVRRNSTRRRSSACCCLVTRPARTSRWTICEVPGRLTPRCSATGERLVPGWRRTKSRSRNCATDRLAARLGPHLLANRAHGRRDRLEDRDGNLIGCRLFHACMVH